jgi:hypothetical protein
METYWKQGHVKLVRPSGGTHRPGETAEPGDARGRVPDGARRRVRAGAGPTPGGAPRPGRRERTGAAATAVARAVRHRLQGMLHAGVPALHAATADGARGREADEHPGAGEQRAAWVVMQTGRPRRARDRGGVRAALPRRRGSGVRGATVPRCEGGAEPAPRRVRARRGPPLAGDQETHVPGEEGGAGGRGRQGIMAGGGWEGGRWSTRGRWPCSG